MSKPWPPMMQVEVLVMGHWLPGIIWPEQRGVPPRIRAIQYSDPPINCWARCIQLRKAPEMQAYPWTS